MSRVRKPDEFEAKKNLIIREAIDLLDKIGYEKFSINKVIASSGMTKGAFFHYFKSKKELIEEIADIFILPMAEVLKEIADDKTILPKQKILVMADSVSEIKGTDSKTTQQLVRLLAKDDNKGIAGMISEKSIETFLPIYERVMIEGNECGQFDIPYPNGSAFMYFNVLASVNKEIGAVLGSKTIDKERFMKLKEKVRAFEDYAKSLFNFESGIRVIDEKLWDIDLK